MEKLTQVTHKPLPKLPDTLYALIGTDIRRGKNEQNYEVGVAYLLFMPRRKKKASS